MKGRLSISLHAAGVRRGDKWVLRGVSWNLRPGERWALIGDNGAGKTQLLKLLCGDVWPTPTAPAPPRGGPAAPRVSPAPPRGSPDTDTRTYRAGGMQLDLIDAKRRIAYVGAELQDKYARYGWNLRVRDLVATGLHRSDLLLLPVTPSQAKRVAATLRSCGLLRLAARQFLSLSYGQKRLALLARALVQDPDWLLLDEFYNGLDTGFRRRIDAVLQGARKRGQSWVATAHRSGDVPRGTRCLLQLDQGLAHPAKRIRASDLAQLAKRAGEQPRRRAVRFPEATSVAGRKGAILLELSTVDLYVDYRRVLRDVDWQLFKGEHWVVHGANGSGKSSFLKLLYGDLSPALGGRIERAGIPRGTPISEWKRQVGYVSPELQTDYAVNVTVSDLVASGRYASIGLVDEATEGDRKAAQRWLRFFDLAAAAEQPARELSYGQLRRALIARAMAADARILLLDEPLTGLDPTQRAGMKRLLQRLMKSVTLVVAVHHAEDLPRGMTHGLHLHNGRAFVTDSYSAT